ncbi:uncharacterized protein LOC109545295 [Dendroctonus ponderosae]
MYKLAVLSLILTIASNGFTAFIGSEDHYYDDCLHPGSNPVTVYDKEVREEGQLLVTKEDTVRVPTSGFTDSPITCISVINQETDENGGYVSVLTGGVGSTFVTFHFKSQLSKGFDFQVSVYYNNATTAKDVTV